MDKVERISAGSYDLNKWLYGGYERGIITMVAGPPGSGKTNFVTLSACSLAKKGSKIIFIDTEGGFSVDRVKQIVGEDYEKILENFFLLEPKSFLEQRKIFQKLLDKVKKDQIGLLVVDSMAMLYRLELGDALKDGDDKNVKEVNREMAQQMRILAEIARKEKIPVLITNQVYKGFLSEDDFRKGKEPETNIVGGDLFKYWSKCIIELKLEGNKRKAIILKHRSLPYKEMSFEIRNEGIFHRGFF